MKYCFECATLLIQRLDADDERNRLFCPTCVETRYENPRIIAFLMVTYRDTLLLCRRAHDPAFGKWTPPAGFMEQGETLQDAAVRETAEETDVRVHPEGIHLYSITSLPRINEVYVGFRASISSDRCHPGLESLEVGFFPESHVPWDTLAYPIMVAYLRRFFRENSTKQFGIHLSRIDERGRLRREYHLAQTPVTDSRD